MNKKNMMMGIAFSGAIILAALIATNVLLPKQLPQSNAGIGAVVDTPITQVIARQSVKDTQEASSRVGYAVKEPTNLPPNYTVQVRTVQPEQKIVTMLASPNEIKQDVTTHNEFFNKQKGILVYVEELSPSFDKDRWLKAWAADNNATLTTIRGNPAAIHGIIGHEINGQKIQLPAELIVLQGNTEIELRGLLSESDLIKAVESML